MNQIGRSRIIQSENTRSAGMPSSDATVMLGQAPVLPWIMSWVARNMRPMRRMIPASIAVHFLRRHELDPATREFQPG